MDKGFEARQKALELMKGINSLEDLKEHQDEIISFLEGSMKFSVDSMKEILNMPLSSEEIKGKVDMFMEGLDMLSDELDVEITRIDGLPGLQGSFNDEMMKRLEHYAVELEELIDKFMDSIEGAFMEGLGEIITDAANEEKEDDA